MGFFDDVEAGQKDNDFYKFKEGEQRFRIMSEPVQKTERYGHGICYPGAKYCDPNEMGKEYLQKRKEAEEKGDDPNDVSTPSLTTKYMCWAILRGGKDKKDRFVILQLNKKMAEKLFMWRSSTDYAFEGFPMPFDISIIADKNAGTTKVKYEMTAARKETPITEAETVEFEKQTPVQQILERLRTKQKERTEGSKSLKVEEADDDEEIDPADIPF